MPSASTPRRRIGSKVNHTILVEQAVAYGELKTTKTGRQRTVQLLQPLAGDLNEWRLASGRPDESALVFPGRDGKPWTDDAWRSWRRKIFAPAAEAAGHPDATPYHLRHSYISLLIHEGTNIIDIAKQAGHSPTVTLNTYAHVIDELPALARRNAQASILEARVSPGESASKAVRVPRRTTLRGGLSNP